MKTAASSGREIPHPPARGGAAPAEKPPAAAERAPAAAAATNGALAVVAHIKPEWRLVPKRNPGPSRSHLVDFPQATLFKRGRQAKLNAHAVRMLAGLGGDVPPPAGLLVRLFVDTTNGLFGLRAAEKGDNEARSLSRDKNSRGEKRWNVGLGRVLEEAGVEIDRPMRCRVVAFGQRTYGFSYRPEVHGEPAS